MTSRVAVIEFHSDRDRAGQVVSGAGKVDTAHHRFNRRPGCNRIEEHRQHATAKGVTAHGGATDLHVTS